MATQFTELSADQISELQSETRQTGVYRQVVEDFIAAGISGADVTNSFPGRKTSSAYQALKKLVSKDEYSSQVDILRVTQNGTETLALIRK